MKKIIKVEFFAKTIYSGSKVTELVDVSIDDDYSGYEIAETIQEYFDCWLMNNVESGWLIQE